MHNTAKMESASPGIALQACDLLVQGGGRTLLNRISLTLLPREVVAIIGPSGAGKSTLLETLCGFRREYAGSVFAAGTDLRNHFDRFRALIGFVPQDDILHLHLTVKRTLHYAALLRLPHHTSKESREYRIQEVIEQLGLRERTDVMVQRLSGGQRKRVSIGLELLSGPPLLFLDEPTSGLDPGTEEDLMRLLQQLAQKGRTIALTTHAMQSLECVNHLAIVYKGHLAYFGPPAQALRFFEVPGYNHLFKQLQLLPPPEAEARFRRSPEYFEYVQQRLPRMN